LSSLRTQRRSEAQSIGESIRRAFAQASGSYAILGFAREQETSSKRNFDLVNQSYVAGVSSILDLLDAQTQLLGAQVGVANAYYGFLEDLMVAEQQIAFLAFLEPESDVAALLDQLEAALSGRM
jgi:outer membrane protein TolC